MDGSNASNIDLGDRLTGHHGVLVLDKKAHDLAGQAGLHLVERLHDLDEANGVFLRDRVAVGSDSICVHSDTPNTVAIAVAVRDAVRPYLAAR